MDKRISDLPLTAAVNTDDTFEKSKHNAAPSERMTVAQLVTFLQTALASLTTVSGKIALNADGSVSLNNDRVTINTDAIMVLGKLATADGTLILRDNLTGSNTIALSGNDGSADFATGKIQLIADGSVSFSGGAATINSQGSIYSGSNTFNGLLTIFNAAGDTIFSLGASAGLFEGGGLPFFSISALDGSASFSAGITTIAATGDIEITDNTQGVILKSPGGTRYRIVVDDAGVLSTVAA